MMTLTPVQVSLFHDLNRKFQVKFAFYERVEEPVIDLSFPIERRYSLIGKVSVEVRLEIKNRNNNDRMLEIIVWEDCFFVENQTSSSPNLQNPLKRRRIGEDSFSKRARGSSSICSVIPNGGPVDRQTNASIIVRFDTHDYMTRFFGPHMSNNNPVIIFGDRVAQFWGIQSIENVIGTLREDDKEEKKYTSELEEGEREGQLVIRVQTPYGERPGNVDVRVVISSLVMVKKNAFTYYNHKDKLNQSENMIQEEEEEILEQDEDDDLLFGNEENNHSNLLSFSPIFDDHNSDCFSSLYEYSLNGFLCPFGSTILSFLAAKGNLEEIRKCLDECDDLEDILRKDKLGFSVAHVASYFRRNDVIEYFVSFFCSASNPNRFEDDLKILMEEIDPRIVMDMKSRLVTLSRSFGNSDFEEFLNFLEQEHLSFTTTTTRNIHFNETNNGEIIKIDEKTGDLTRILITDKEEEEKEEIIKITTETNICDLKAGFDFDYEKFVQEGREGEVKKYIVESLGLTPASSIETVLIESGSTYITFRITGFQTFKMMELLLLSGRNQKIGTLNSIGIELKKKKKKEEEEEEEQSVKIKVNEELYDEEKKIYLYKRTEIIEDGESVVKEVKMGLMEKQISEISRNWGKDGWSVDFRKNVILVRNVKVSKVKIGRKRRSVLFGGSSGKVRYYWVDVVQDHQWWLIKHCFKRGIHVDAWVKPMEKNHGRLCMIQTTGN